MTVISQTPRIKINYNMFLEEMGKGREGQFEILFP
jgi:hypothetical protein